MAGLKVIVPTTFTDTTLPLAVHGAGISGYNYRHVAKILGAVQGLTNGADVPSWPSLGSIATPFTSAANGSADDPVYRTNSGNPFVEFDGTDDGLGMSGYVDNSVKTVVMVMRKPTTGNASAMMSGGATLNINRNGNLTLSGNTGGAPNVSISADVWHFVAVVSNLNSSFVVVDGVKSSQAPANVTGRMQSFRLGRESTSYCRFDLAEVIAYSDAKSEANLATIRAALQAAYPGLGL